MQSIVVERVDERAQYVLLSHQLGEIARPPLACQDLIAHRGYTSSCECSGIRIGGDLPQPHPGARVHRYRCSLPGLTGFTAYRREGTKTSHHKLAEREGFEPSIRFRIHTFQACAFNRSATSPISRTGKLKLEPTVAQFAVRPRTVAVRVGKTLTISRGRLYFAPCFSIGCLHAWNERSFIASC